jgi:hypothetical protein
MECHFWVMRGEKRERRQSGLERKLRFPRLNPPHFSQLVKGGWGSREGRKWGQIATFSSILGCFGASKKIFEKSGKR